MKTKRIPIVLAADSNYELMLRVTIVSLLISARKETQYEVIVITDSLFDIAKLENIKKNFPSLNIKNCQINENYLANAKIRNEGLSIFTYVRLFIPKILSEYDKCIYIDTDIVVLEDLAELYEINIEDYYVAGVKDYALQTNLKFRDKLKNSLEIKSMERYFNAGVLLLNLKKIREEHIYELFVENIGKNWAFEDQDILNKCCYNKITFLPVRYNILYRYYKRGEFWQNEFYSEKDVLEAQERPAIVHFTGRDMKPWKLVRSRAAKLWWKVARDALTKAEYDFLYTQACEFQRRMQWDYLIEKCKNRDAIIWGASDKGEVLCQWLLKAGINVRCFCDNNEKKQGAHMEGIEVKSLKTILAEGDINNSIFIVASQAYFDTIEKQLKANGINSFVRFFYKTEFYYMALDESFFEDELREIEEKEKVKREDFTPELSHKYWMHRWIYR